MQWFIVLWIGHVCPGGWFSGLIPAQAKPLVCESKAQFLAFDRESAAQAKIRELGPGARLFSVKGLRFSEQNVRWKTSVEFGGG